MFAKQIHALNDAVLAKGKSLYAVVAGRAQRLPAPIALDDCNILAVISTIHLLLFLIAVVDVSGTGYRFLSCLVGNLAVKCINALFIGQLS